MKPYFGNSGCIIQEQEILSLIFHEILNNKQNSFWPSANLKQKLESLSRDDRRELVRKERDGTCPLFFAALHGHAMAAEYLITSCDANLEQKNLFEVVEEKTFHLATPLWASSVANHLNVVKLLVRLGANINSISDSGSTAVRSACFMSNVAVVQYLINSGADFSKPNFNGGTCLINSVQSIELCKFLLSKGVDVNARDIQNKTALHYAIQEYRLETTKILIEHGANVFSQSRYGDDALQTACLKGAEDIFDYLKSRIYYTPERLANAYELLGTTMLTDDQVHHANENRAIAFWRYAIEIRNRENIPKEILPPKKAFNNVQEFRTHEELTLISMDLDDLRMTALVISERILGQHHRDFLFRLLYRGAFFADSMRYDSCLQLWLYALEIRSERNTILHGDTVFVGQAIIRLMLNLNLRDSDFVHVGMHQHDMMPTFEEANKVFQLLTFNIVEMKKLLQLRPIFKKQQDNFDKILKCITHAIYLMIDTANGDEEKMKIVYSSVYHIVKNDIRTSNQDSLLHMCVSRLNFVKHGYFQNHNLTAKSVFPNIDVVKLLLKCGSNVNARNECRSTPLFIASNPYNYNFKLIELLLNSGAELDYPNKTGDRPVNLITANPNNNVPIVNYLTLKCLSAQVICKFRIPYRNLIPKSLEKFVQEHH